MLPSLFLYAFTAASFVSNEYFDFLPIENPLRVNMNVFVISCVYSKGIIPEKEVRLIFWNFIFLKAYAASAKAFEADSSALITIDGNGTG